MITYLGKKFKNYEEMEEANKQAHIENYKLFVQAFNLNSTLEASIVLDDKANVLIDRFGLTPEQVEEIELSVY